MGINKKNSSQKKILIFGAGKIGRSFIGQLFSRAGYEIVFIDISEELVDALNQDEQYPVVIKSDKEDEVIEVKNVRGIHIDEIDEIVKEFQYADLAATCVGKNGLTGIIPIISISLIERFKTQPNHPVDIIIAENMRDADVYFRNELKRSLPESFPLNTYVGLVETSIGKMVPIMKAEDLQDNILRVFAEPYNTLIVDRKGFKSEIPEIKGLQTQKNMKVWVDRKLFIHNLGHACAAYCGYYHYPESMYLYEVLKHKEIHQFVKETMMQSAQILLSLYPGEFTTEQLEEHIDDLISRFRNKALGDTIFRVGSDLYRKFSSDDRLFSPFHAGFERGLPIDKIAETICYGLHFRAKDEHGEFFPGDAVFISEMNEKGVEYILRSVSKTNEEELEFILNKFELLMRIKS